MKYQRTGKIIPYTVNKLLFISILIMTAIAVTPGHICAKEEKKISVQDIKERIYLVLDIPRTEVYVNEKVPVSLKLYSDWLDLEDVQVSEPLSSGLVTTKFVRGETKIVKKDGVNYVVLEYNKWFFAPEAGEFTIEPVKVKCRVARRGKRDGKEVDLLNENEDFYNSFLGRRRHRSLELSTDPFSVKALPLPMKGRPEGFNGAVGSFTFDFKDDWSDFGSDNIVRFLTRIEGDGNYNTVRMPHIPEKDGLRLYDSRSERSDKSILFEQTIKVEPDKVGEIPVIKFVFFDPRQAKYVSFKKGPFRMKVKKRKEEPERVAYEEKEPPEEWITRVKDSPGRFYKEGPVFYKSGIFMFFQILPLIFLSLAIVEHRRRWILTSDSEYAVYIRASRKARLSLGLAEKLIKQGKAKEFYDLTFNMLQQYLAERFSLAPGSITEVDVDELIGSKKGLKEIAGKIKNVFADCYLARYTRLKPDKDDMTDTFDKAKEVIDFLNQRRNL